jgi:hypothetical protein
MTGTKFEIAIKINDIGPLAKREQKRYKIVRDTGHTGFAHDQGVSYHGTEFIAAS